MILKDFNRITPHSDRKLGQSLARVFLIEEKCEHRGTRSRHSSIGSKGFQGFVYFRINPYGNRLQIVASRKIGPLLSELLRKKWNFQGLRVSCQGWIMKNLRRGRRCRGHEDGRPTFRDLNGLKFFTGSLGKRIGAKNEKRDVGTKRLTQ